MRFSNPFIAMRNYVREYEPMKQAHASTATSGKIQPYVRHQASASITMPMQDRSMLLRPLKDEHLVEVYLEAKAMQLSDDFIALIEETMRTRNIEAPDASR